MEITRDPINLLCVTSVKTLSSKVRAVMVWSNSSRAEQLSCNVIINHYLSTWVNKALQGKHNIKKKRWGIDQQLVLWLGHFTLVRQRPVTDDPPSTSFGQTGQSTINWPQFTTIQVLTSSNVAKTLLWHRFGTSKLHRPVQKIVQKSTECQPWNNNPAGD